MNLSDPRGLFLLALAAPIVVLYLLKTRRARVRVGSTWLWQRAERDLLAKHPFRRLRWVLPLLLQLAILSLLALSAAHPFQQGQERLTDQTVLIFDVSASMQARDKDGTTRLELAKKRARELLATGTPGGEVMILSGGSGVLVASPFERDRVRLERAIDGIEAEDAEGSLRPAVELAQARLAHASGKRRILVLTDGELADRSPLQSTDTELRIIELGEPVANVGIVHVDARTGARSESGDQQVKVFVRLQNFSDASATRFVTLRQRNVKEPLASRRVQLGPGADVPVVLSFDATTADFGTGLVAELDPHDRFEVDDRAYAIVPENRMLQVVLLERQPSPWFVRALLADPEVEVWTAKTEAEMNQRGAAGALLVYVGTCPSALPDGHFLVLAPPSGPCLLAQIGPEVANPKITSFRQSDPRLRFLDLADVQLERSHTIEGIPERDSLVHSDHGVLVAHVEIEGRLGTIVGFDFGASDWPLKASFVLFVRNLVEHAREHRLGERALTLRAGSAVALPVPFGVNQVELSFAPGDFDHDGTALVQKYDTRGGSLALPALVEAGFHQLSWQGAAARTTLIAVSLASDRESDLRERPLPETGPAGAHASKPARPAVLDWSWLLALLALSALVVEVTIATARIPRPNQRGA
jgi:hypothetical protein